MKGRRSRSTGASALWHAARQSCDASARASPGRPPASDASSKASRAARTVISLELRIIAGPSPKRPDHESRRASPKTASSVNHSLHGPPRSGADVKRSDSPGPPLVAIVGRANVGKSTLFNRLLGEGRALVEDRPGATRDRTEVSTAVEGRQAVLVDTAGLDPEADAGI